MFSVERMAKVLTVSKSGYYAFISRPLSRQKKERRYLDVLVKAAFEASHGRYGSLKISRELAAQGNPYRRSRVADSMRRQDLRSKVCRKFVQSGLAVRAAWEGESEAAGGALGRLQQAPGRGVNCPRVHGKIVRQQIWR